MAPPGGYPHRTGPEEVVIYMAAPPPAPGTHPPGAPRTRAAGLWFAAVLFAALLLLLLIFILQNPERAEISFFGARAHPPVGVALLLAAVFGVLLVALPGTARILQLRMLARRQAHQARAPEDDKARPSP
jgi:uncharacterized integral membrane protein